MPFGPMAMPSLQAAGIIGVWKTDVAAGRSLLDVGAATFMAGNSDLADAPLPLEVALGRMHPDDRGWVFGRIHNIRRTGGSFAAEFRIIDEVGNVRWILNRGFIAPDEHGRMFGQGAYIDTTDSHTSQTMSPTATLPVSTADALDDAAEQCIRARLAIDRTDNSKMRLLADLLLMEVGRVLARQPRS